MKQLLGTVKPKSRYQEPLKNTKGVKGMKSVFDQTQFTGLQLKNRFIRSATYDGFADERGYMTKSLFQVYDKLAEGGVGVIITGSTSVTDREQLMPGQMAIYDDSFIPDYQKLTEVMHENEVVIILQLACLGSQTSSKGNGKVIWGPSAVEDLGYKITPQAMTEVEIHHVQTAFAEGALRAQKSGFDGVQLHVAHGYLLSKFLNPYYNLRTDRYGGSLANRARMIIETYQAIRAKVGPEYPVLIKINCADFMDQGLTFAECKQVCRQLAQLGINAIEVSGGSLSSSPGEGVARNVKNPEQEEYFKAYAAELAQEINVPVIAVGGNRDIHSLTELINQTQVEYIALSRPLICESDLINRWQQGDNKRAKCISCNKCFLPGGTTCILHRKKRMKHNNC